LGEENEIENILPYEEEDQTKEILLSLVSEFMKNHLTQEAYLIFELESFPPEYIRARTKSRISGKLLVEYLGLPDTSTSVKYVNELRDEVKDTLLEARNYFSNNTPYVFS
jgi:protoheme ferro-lyase